MRKYTCFSMILIAVFALVSPLSAQWVQVGLGNSFVSTLAVKVGSSSGNILYAGTINNGLFISTNDGGNWTPANNGLANNQIFEILVSENSVIAGTGGSGLFISTNNGTSWVQSSGASNAFVYCMTADTSGSGDPDLFAGTNLDVYRSTDNGFSWFPINTPFSGYRTALATAPRSGGGTNLFAGDGYFNLGDGHIYLSTDTGMNWSMISNGINIEMVNTIVVIPSGESDVNIFAGTEGAGIFRSSDEGSSWTEVNNGLGTGVNLYIYCFASANTSLFTGTFGGGVFLSTNNGTNWVAVNEGLTNQSVVTLMVSDTYLFAGTYNGGVWRRPLNDFIPVELTSFSATLSNDNVELSWITSTETNNQGFEIQRSKDGEFETIGFVEGHGTTTESQTYSFTDNNVIAGNYNYRLKQIDYDGTFEYSNVIQVEAMSPFTFSLEQNYPNPFNPSTKIRYTIPNVIASGAKQSQLVTLKVYDVLGKEVATLVNEYKPAGSFEVEFGAANLPSGTYFYQLKTGPFVETKKMILLR